MKYSAFIYVYKSSTFVYQSNLNPLLKNNIYGVKSNVGVLYCQCKSHHWSWQHECGWAALCHRCYWPCAGRGLGSRSRVPGACGAKRGPWRTQHPSQTEPSPLVRNWNHDQLFLNLRKEEKQVLRGESKKTRKIKIHSILFPLKQLWIQVPIKVGNLIQDCKQSPTMFLYYVPYALYKGLECKHQAMMKE